MYFEKPRADTPFRTDAHVWHRGLEQALKGDLDFVGRLAGEMHGAVHLPKLVDQRCAAVVDHTPKRNHRCFLSRH